MKTLTAYLAEKTAAAEDFASRNNLHPATGENWLTLWKTEYAGVVGAALKAGEPGYDGWEKDFPGLAFRLKRGTL